MKIFVSGTDTGIGKTLICSWLALHTAYPYFKPIQTGAIDGCDSEVVSQLSKSKIYPEKFLFNDPVSPNIAAKIVGEKIELDKIELPKTNNLIIEGAGGLLVPINSHDLMIDLIEKLDAPVILVSKSRLGAVNQTLLSLEALNSRKIKTLGVIMNGKFNHESFAEIELYGKTKILANFPDLYIITTEALKSVMLTDNLNKIFSNQNESCF